MNHAEFDWDFENINHIARHGVLPEEAEEVLSNSTVEIPSDQDSLEERLSEVGVTNAGRILLVSTTQRRHRLRVVTAFKPSARIVKYYLAHRGQ